MAVAKGHDLRCAIAKAATWGTIVADPTTDAMFPLESYSVKKSVDLIANPEKNDTPMRSTAAAGVSRVDGSLGRVLHYQGDEVALALAMGTAGAPVQVGTTAYYTHSLLAKSSLQGLFASLFTDLETNTEEVDSAKFNGWTISGAQADRVKIAYPIMGREMDIAGNMAFGSATENANAKDNHVLFSQLLFYINDNTAGDVTAGTAVDLSGFSVQQNNNLVEHFTTAGLRKELVRGGPHEVTGSFAIDTYEDTTRVADIVNFTLKKAAFVFTSGSYAFKLFIPGLRLTGDLPEVSDFGRIPQALNFVSEKVSSNPTGMTSTMPYIQVVSQLSTDPLA